MRSNFDEFSNNNNYNDDDDDDSSHIHQQQKMKIKTTPNTQPATKARLIFQANASYIIV